MNSTFDSEDGDTMYFSVRRQFDAAEIVNPKGQVFCTVFMGEGNYEMLTAKRAEWIAQACNNHRRLEQDGDAEERLRALENRIQSIESGMRELRNTSSLHEIYG